MLIHTEGTSRSVYLPAVALIENSVQKREPALMAFSGRSGELMQEPYAVLQATDCKLPEVSAYRSSTKYWAA